MVDFTGTAGDDSLVGTAGDDSFNFTLGTDTLIGGEGYDDIFASTYEGVALPNGTVVDFGAGSIVGTGVNHSISGIESIWIEGGSNITLRGGEADDSLNLTITSGTSLIEGGGGNDSIVLEALSTGAAYGGDGDDSLYVFGVANATIEGGSGDDTLKFDGYDTSSLEVLTNSAGHYILTFSNGSITLLDEVEDFTTNDNAGNETSFTFADLMSSPEDDDTPTEGTAANDTFLGTAGDDTLVGLAGNDEFYFSLGNDTLIGGEGTDRFEVLRSNGTERPDLPDGTVIDLAAGTLVATDLSQTLSGIENVEVRDAEDVILRGDEGRNNLSVLLGSGTLEGGAGDDKLTFASASGAIFGGAGDDVLELVGPTMDVTLEGGSGTDELLFFGFSTSISVSSNDLGQRVLNYQSSFGEPIAITLLDEIESFVFFDTTLTYAEMTPPDPILGTDVGEVITGTAGDDRIEGLGGNDWITPGVGRDIIDGGDGIDMVSFVGGVQALVNLEDGYASVGQGPRQFLIDIENVTGTSANDTITGDDGANVLRGLGGNDNFFATGGGDRLIGGASGDILYVGDAGEDTSVSLLRGRIWEGVGAGTRLEGIEYIIARGGNDQLTGDHNTNILNAGQGDDTLMGNGGDDILYGEGGQDVALYSQNQDQYEITLVGDGANNTYQVAYIGAGSHDGTDLLFNIETLQFADGDLVL